MRVCPTASVVTVGPSWIRKKTELEKPRVEMLPCQNCGNLVAVVMPFVGCVFCSDCQQDGTYIYREQF